MRAVSGTEWQTIEHHLGEIARELDDPDALAPMLTRTTTLYVKSEREIASFVQAMGRARDVTMQRAGDASAAPSSSRLGYWFSTLESFMTS